ncbi:MAG: hypothetical protein O3B13_06870 [Planctomycetota bacterium]|nr:hypothetical protein [Planctomycetota bacterium]
MNCDQAFEFLTDTRARGSESLIRHLEECPRCRDMAELLDPALDLFGEVAESGGELSFKPTTDVDVVDRTGDRTRPPHQKLPLAESKAEITKPGIAYRPWLQTSRWRAAASQDGLHVAAFLMFIAVLMAAIVNVERSSRNDAVAISLPENCQRTEATESTSDNVVAGCVACHLRAEALIALHPIQRTHARQLVQRCVNCHLDMTTDHYLAGLDSEAVFTPETSLPVQLTACLFGRRDG